MVLALARCGAPRSRELTELCSKAFRSHPGTCLPGWHGRTRTGASTPGYASVASKGWKGRTVDGYVLRNAPGWTWKANGRDNQGRFDFLVIEDLAYGVGPPLHIHAVQEDSFYVLEGIVTAQLGDDVVELGTGDFASAPPGVPHSLTNAHPDQSACKLVNLLTPGIGFDRYVSQIGAVASEGDQEALARLHAEYGVTIVGPSVAEHLGLHNGVDR
jgi:mannose-6-phosphate isomerase-like protein (cupin superfamily)